MTTSPACVFCQIVAGTAPARIVASSTGAIAFLPLRPAVAGHTLVLPRQHLTRVLDMDRQTAHAVTDVVLDVAARIQAAFGPDGLNIVQSTGAAASQTVPHLHVHVVPRSVGDALPALWPPQHDWPATVLDQLAQRLREAGGADQRGPAART